MSPPSVGRKSSFLSNRLVYERLEHIRALPARQGQNLFVRSSAQGTGEWPVDAATLAGERLPAHRLDKSFSAQVVYAMDAAKASARPLSSRRT